jgi:DNA processing protein
MKHRTLDADKIARACRELGSLGELWNSPVRRLELLGFSKFALSEFERLRSTTDLQTLIKRVEQLRKSGTRMITYCDDTYPELLRELGDQVDGPPLVLFHKGSLLDFRRCVAIVGTRNLSSHGYVMTRRFAKTIAARGFTIVSGLARGTDVTAHRAALEATGGRTIAVLPWMEPLYPPEHEQLAQDIQEHGAMLSEYYERRTLKLAPGDFVLRNRITSGMSLCLIAVESGEEGGTVHQVRFAVSQGKQVFVVKPQMSRSRIVSGYRSFVKAGAVPVSSPRTVLQFLSKVQPLGSMDEFVESRTTL